MAFNIETVLTKMDGKIDLISQAMDNTKDDLRVVRERLHDLSNEVQKLIALNLPGTLTDMRSDITKIDQRVVILEHDFHARRGAVNAAKLLYGLGGTTIGAGVVAAIAKIAGAM